LLARAQQTPACAAPTGRSVQRCESTIRFTFQNVRSLIHHTTDGSNAKQDELFAHMHTYKINIALLAETWRLGSEDLKAGLQGEFLMKHRGLSTQTCDRGQLGVAIVLDTDVQHVFEQADSWKKAYGNRILAARLRTKDAKGKPLRLFVVVGYAPTLQHTQEEREEFQQNFDDCMTEIGKDEIPVIGLDANAQLVTTANGTAGRLGEGGRKGGVLGRWGLKKRTSYGQDFLDICSSHLLCTPLTWFQHKNYQTWKTAGKWQKCNLVSGMASVASDMGWL